MKSSKAGAIIFAILSLACLPAEGSQAGTIGAGGDQAPATASFLNPELCTLAT
jgi:hypothetical protein